MCHIIEGPVHGFAVIIIFVFNCLDFVASYRPVPFIFLIKYGFMKWVFKFWYLSIELE